jgi:hypothetical protein
VLTYPLSEMGNKIHNDLYWFRMFLVSWTWLAIDYKTTYHFEDVLQNQESTVMLFSSPVVIVPHVVTAIFRQRLSLQKEGLQSFCHCDLRYEETGNYMLACKLEECSST